LPVILPPPPPAKEDKDTGDKEKYYSFFVVNFASNTPKYLRKCRIRDEINDQILKNVSTT